MFKLIHYCLQMFLKNLQINAMKYMDFILLISDLHLDKHGKRPLKNANLELLTDADMLLMIKAGIRSGMCQWVHRYVKANNKYMKNYHKNIDSSYLTYLYANNLYGWTMSQKLPVNGFKWKNDLSRFNEDFIKTTMKIVM